MLARVFRLLLMTATGVGLAVGGYYVGRWDEQTRPLARASVAPTLPPRPPSPTVPVAVAEMSPPPTPAAPASTVPATPASSAPDPLRPATEPTPRAKAAAES